MKVKSIKPKVDAKIAKAKGKIAKKCGKGKCAKCAVALLALSALAGCLVPSAPSRSQSITFRDSVVNIYGGGAETNDVARVEMLTQAMAIETSGSESTAMTPTQTTDVRPDVDVNVGAKGAGKTTGTIADAVADKAAECVGDACSDAECNK